jgi:hypothetical protein
MQECSFSEQAKINIPLSSKYLVCGSLCLMNDRMVKQKLSQNQNSLQLVYRFLVLYENSGKNKKSFC